MSPDATDWIDSAMPFESTRKQHADVLAGIDDRSLRHAVLRAFSEAAVIRRGHRRVSARATAAVTSAWLATNLPGSAGNFASGVILGLGTGHIAADTLGRARSLTRIRTTERRCADAGEYAAAAMLCGQAIDLMSNLQYSRTRAALACIDLARYTAYADAPAAMAGAALGAQGVLEDLPRRSRNRFAAAIQTASDEFADIALKPQRILARLTLSMMAEHARVEDIGPVLVDIGIDMYSVGEQRAGMFLDPTSQLVGEDGEAVPEEVLGSLVGGTLEHADRFIAEGLRRILTDRGGEATDQFVRDLIATEQLADRSVLTAYLGAMEQTEDPRTEVFRNLLGNGEPYIESALAVIGIPPDPPAPSVER